VDDIARAKEAINECYLTVLNMGDRWSFATREGQFTITSAGDKYSFSGIASQFSVGDIVRIFNMTNDTVGFGNNLEGMDWLSQERLSTVTQDGDTKACPQSFAVFGTQVRFYPWPDRTYTIGCFYQQGDVAMASDATVPIIPLSWRHKILVPYAASRLWEMHSGAGALSHAKYYTDQYERNMVLFKEQFSAAQQPQIGLDSPTWNSDLDLVDMYYD
jgi:hypothetical protein